MDLFWDGLKEALRLLISLDRQLVQVFLLSLYVHGIAVFLAAAVGIPTGTLLALRSFPGKSFILGILHTFMGLPPVVVGLVVLIAISRHGSLGQFELLYTPAAMILAQFIIATPIVAGFSHAAIADINPKMRLQALSLGANQFQLMATLMKEARLGLIAAVIAGFGRVVAEVGAVMIVGGNLSTGTGSNFKNLTMVMTTFIVQETRKGQWERSIALGVILIFFAFLINAALTYFQQGSERK
jgi:tungstate transport system permease protein